MAGCLPASAGWKAVIEGLKLLVPAGCSALVRERMAHLNRNAAKWQLYELQEREEEITRVEILDRGNISARLVHCSDEIEVQARFAESIALVRTLMPEAEMGMLSPGGNCVSLPWSGVCASASFRKAWDFP